MLVLSESRTMEYEEIITIASSLVDEFVATLKKETKKNFRIQCVINAHPPPPPTDCLENQQFLFTVTWAVYPAEADITTLEITVK